MVLVHIHGTHWHSQNSEKNTHQRETTGSSSDSLQLGPFSKWELLKEKNLLPEGANSFLYEQFLIVWKITFAI